MVKGTSSEESMSANSGSRSHGLKEFHAEALLLSRVHHRNLVSLIGYCRDSNQLGLVYEYAARGSLRDHLSAAAIRRTGRRWRCMAGIITKPTCMVYKATDEERKGMYAKFSHSMDYF
ncbi:probable LRR receptor-like serine/threonine-protein kinase At5g16900 [Musa acuminata AAA Group]|uniref:probable LRR receptor-like serine/threonine-protein kinase At5g16900 n=1 Tax=Musa acuminata AAA Group TaxID=214697 RepID=UPI0031D72705